VGLRHVLTSGLVFATIANAYLFLVMISTSARIWGYTDYPAVIKTKVPPQTRREKRIALLVGLPWFVFVLGFPVVSTYALKSKLGHEIAFGTAFLNLFVMLQLAMLVDLVLLDWLLVSRITPRFVIIPGTEKADYKNFSSHYRGHAKAAVALTIVSLAVAAVVSWL